MLNKSRSVWIMGWLLIFLLFSSNSGWAQKKEKKGNPSVEEILIFRTSPGVVQNAEGWFHFQVSAFSPILVVKVNDFAQMVKPGADWAEFKISYFLKPGKNLFSIFVQTEKGQKKHDIYVTFIKENKEKKDKPPLSGALLLGQVNSDNMLHVPEGNSKIKSNKYDILFSMTYWLHLNDKSEISLNGLLKFDKQQDQSLSSEEVLFRSFSADYQHQDFLGFDLNTGLGQNVVSIKKNQTGTNSSDDFTKDLQSQFVFLAGQKKFLKKIKTYFKLQLEQQDKMNSTSQDGMLNLMSLGGKFRWSSFRIGTQMDLRTANLEDNIKSYDSTVTDSELNYIWDPWLFSFNFQNLEQKHRAVDPSNLLKLHNKKDTITLSSKYILNPSIILDLAYKTIKHTSNNVLQSYAEKQTIMQIIWIF